MRIDDEDTTDILAYIEHHIGLQTLIDLYIDATHAADSNDVVIVFDEPKGTASAVRRLDLTTNVPEDVFGEDIAKKLEGPPEEVAGSVNFWFLALGENSLSCFHVCGIKAVGEA